MSNLYVSISTSFDEHYQQDDVNVEFHSYKADNLPSPILPLDVTFLLGTEEKYPQDIEGVLVTYEGEIRFGNLTDCIDRWPNSGDWFFTWEDLLAIYEDQKERVEGAKDGVEEVEDGVEGVELEDE